MSTTALIRRTTSSLTKQSSRDTELEETRSSTQLECDQVYKGIKRWKAHEGAVLLTVVRKETIPLLKDRAKPRWWKGKKAKAAMCFTTPESLQREIDSSASDGQVHELFLLISRYVDLQQSTFSVPENIENLYIIRCANVSKDPGTVEGNSKLVLNGGSKFCGVRLDEWQAKHVDEHNIILGHDVVIQVTMGIPWTARDAMGIVSKQQREDVARHFKDMCDAKIEGRPEWNRWRAPVNKLLDVAAGTTTLAQVVECYAGGIAIQVATKAAEHGIEGAFKVSAGLLCLGGPGQIALAGVGAAAAIYFIPWDTVWGWFRSAFGALLTWIMRAWENLKSWMQSAVAEIGQAGQQQVKNAIEMRVKAVLPA
ncbi:hypothetical protein Daus18300_011392 [Diaporthe australafricana]|uniref:Uncharacterized protein n=1 Tax=Diaporthe australafricana TaxID=127596 RepID=A0ABR3W6M2_9PEZI